MSRPYASASTRFEVFDLGGGGMVCRTQGDPEQLQFCGAGAISLQDRDNYAVLMRVALLSSLRGADTTDNLGFRCARSLPKENP